MQQGSLQECKDDPDKLISLPRGVSTIALLIASFFRTITQYGCRAMIATISEPDHGTSRSGEFIRSDVFRFA